MYDEGWSCARNFFELRSMDVLRVNVVPVGSTTLSYTIKDPIGDVCANKWLK